jgi:hypothetical protein
LRSTGAGRAERFDIRVVSVWGRVSAVTLPEPPGEVKKP